jgi:hypothetical protein
MKFVDVNPYGDYVKYPRLDGFEVTFWTLIVKDSNVRNNGWF